MIVLVARHIVVEHVFLFLIMRWIKNIIGSGASRLVWNEFLLDLDLIVDGVFSWTRAFQVHLSTEEILLGATLSVLLVILARAC